MQPTSTGCHTDPIRRSGSRGKANPTVLYYSFRRRRSVKALRFNWKIPVRMVSRPATNDWAVRLSFERKLKFTHAFYLQEGLYVCNQISEETNKSSAARSITMTLKRTSLTPCQGESASFRVGGTYLREAVVHMEGNLSYQQEKTPNRAAS